MTEDTNQNKSIEKTFPKTKFNKKVDLAFTSIYAFIHFVIDFSCISALLICANSFADGIDVTTSILLVAVYDMVAFAFQMPIGLIVDKMNKNTKLGIAACLLVMVGVVIAVTYPMMLPWLSIGLVAIGNAVFHCVGGVDVLNVGRGRASLPGAFIGTGAMGVFLAGVLTKMPDTDPLVGAVLALLIISVMLLFGLDMENSKKGFSVNAPFAVEHLGKTALIGFGFLFICVMLRSYTGFCMAYPWKADFTLAAVTVVSVVLGKASGGFIADRFGFLRISIFSLGAAAVLFLFSWEVPVCGIAATFLFNFTMPITLVAMSNMFPNAKGFAFGCATFALSIGAVPMLLGFTTPSPVALAVLSALSLCSIAAGLKLTAQEAIDQND